MSCTGCLFEHRSFQMNAFEIHQQQLSGQPAGKLGRSPVAGPKARDLALAVRLAAAACIRACHGARCGGSSAEAAMTNRVDISIPCTAKQVSVVSVPHTHKHNQFPHTKIESLYMHTSSSAEAAACMNESTHHICNLCTSLRWQLIVHVCQAFSDAVARQM